MCGRRWDLDIIKKINFSDDDCLMNLKNKIKSDGKLHGYSGVDYFIFKKNPFYYLTLLWEDRVGTIGCFSVL